MNNRQMQEWLRALITIVYTTEKLEVTQTSITMNQLDNGFPVSGRPVI